MKLLDPSFVASQAASRDVGIRPAYFAWFRAKNRTTGADETMGLWSGDDDIAINVQTPEGGLTSRTYIGGCNLSFDSIPSVANLTDEPINISMSQIADATQQLVRGYDLRLAYCELHAATFNGGAFSSAPQLEWIGIVDQAPISTPAAGGEGNISLTIRSEIMSQLTSINPAKSSDSHQKRRQAGDAFSRYAGVVKAMQTQWFKG